MLADGRMLVRIADTTTDPIIERFAAMAPDGQVLSVLDHDLPPLHELLVERSTVQGNDAFVLVARLGYDSQMGASQTELIAYRLDPQSNWLRMRSIPLKNDVDGYADLVLSDGTVLMWTAAYRGGSPRVTAYLPDGTKRVAWRLSDSPGAGITGFRTLLVGPREPSGPSLRQE